MERADQALYWAKAHGRDAALQWTAATAAAGRPRASARRAAPDERVDALAAIADEADPTPGGGHGRRVADLSVALAARAGLVAAAPGAAAPRGARPRRRQGADPRRPAHPSRPARTLEAAHVRQHAALGAALGAGVLDAEQAAGSATTTSAGTAPATPTARPASTSPTARGSSRSPTPGTR